MPFQKLLQKSLILFKMVFERLARFKLTFTTLFIDVLATEKKNTATLNASYKVNIIWQET